MTKKDLRNAMFGLAIGNALGVPYEFMDRGSFECMDIPESCTGWKVISQKSVWRFCEIKRSLRNVSEMK